MTSLTRDLAEFAHALQFADLPALAVERAKASIGDAIGCALAGARSAEAEPVAAMAAADGGAPAAQVFGRALRLPPAAAALVNGTAAHAMDFDDSSPPMIGHPSASLASALFALGEGRGASGRDVIAAYAAGLEAAARLGRHLNPSHYAAGWHATATLGTLGAAVASAKLLGLDAARIRTSIGIAASSAGGVRKNFGSGVKPLHAGFAARNGVVAARLAAAGMTADPDALDGERGFIDVFRGKAVPDLTQIRFAVPELELVASGVGLKPYPCCGCTHSALDALLDLRAAHVVAAANVARIHCTMNSLVPDILVHHRPRTPAQAKFSMEYCLAVALIDGDCGVAQFAAPRVVEPGVQDLLARVETSVDPAIAYRNGVYPASVTLHLRDGTTLARHVEEATGNPDRPMSPEARWRKFVGCARTVLAEPRVMAAAAALDALDDCPDLSQLAPLLGA